MQLGTTESSSQAKNHLREKNVFLDYFFALLSYNHLSLLQILV